VRAQENEPPVTQGIQQENGQQEAGKETAPAITLPENLQAAAGTPLKEIGLPENWAWADESTVLSADTTTYPAYVTVDDETYDYAETEGYHAEGHYVEVQLSVTVELPEETTEEESAPVTIQKNSLSRSTVPTPYALGDVEINEANFPDAAFRKYLKESTTINPDSNDTLSAEEIAKVTTISAPLNVADLRGIEKFSNLKLLYCSSTGITSLDVSNNKKLEKLYCQSNTALTTLNVNGASALKKLDCYSTGISSLDVSNNTKLETLWCQSTGISSLDVSSNANLTELNCSSNAALTTLNVNGASALKTLQCYSTGITSLDVSSNANLTELNCYSNAALTTLNVNGASALK
ncbi:leucine-rich repeat domain-containing protein, partial [Candidatus Stoquefichus massiliensis]|uniref:leucine-rich repeat domain-containing protein n=1 Tax=Candidatus Stoquefichus massiliensis TaxID=1470350 RepID=UPI0018CB6B78